MTTELIEGLGINVARSLRDVKTALGLIAKPSLAQAAGVHELANIVGSKDFTGLKGLATERIYAEMDKLGADELVIEGVTFRRIFKTVVDQYNPSPKLDKLLAKKAELAAELKKLDIAIKAEQDIVGAAVDHMEPAYIKIMD